MPSQNYDLDVWEIMEICSLNALETNWADLLSLEEFFQFLINHVWMEHSENIKFRGASRCSPSVAE